jgi:lipopolysaccharide biosynthesis protein
MYLPQFHPIPENDEWWEPGFTEWTNVTKARPLYKGHYQPDLPSELGFYDLRVSETREQQATLAREHGVSAFCYYHYWFGNGRRLLERPFSEVLESGKPDFPFMLCWANQTWYGVWHGLDKRVLVEQVYPGEEDDWNHFRAVLPAFRDSRYLRLDGKPVFMVYAPMSHPGLKDFVSRWRHWAVEASLPGLYLIAEHSDARWDAKAFGLDAYVLLPTFLRRRAWTPWTRPLEKLRNKAMDLRGMPSSFDYRQLTSYFLPEDRSSLAMPCVISNWDNTPRSGARGVVLHDSSPDAFGRAVSRALRISGKLEADRFLFVKSWNEWGEGNHLEPCRRFGRGYLQALAHALRPPVEVAFKGGDFGRR